MSIGTEQMFIGWAPDRTPQQAARVSSSAPRVGHPAWQRYGLALLLGGAAVGVKLALSPLLTRDEPVLLFFAATLLAATVGGLGPGLLVTAIGTLCDEYFFMAPYGTWHLNGLDQVLRLTLFACEGCAISLICARTLTARRAAEANAAEARELQRRVTEIADHERQRLGHDLHDGLGQQLTGIGLLTRRLAARLTDRFDAEAADASALTSLVREALSQAHDLCRTLDPVMDDPQGLPQALRELSSKAGRLLEVFCLFEQVGCLDPLEPAAGFHLYRIAQEAISNAARHGRAEHIRIRLESVDGMLRLQVRDDGRGFPAPVTSAAEGMGLRIMRYRAELLGGSVHVQGLPEGVGTLVECEVPTRAARSSETVRSEDDRN